MSKTKPVRISRSLEDEFDRLPNKSDWDPTGFPEFVRDAVRAYLREHQLRAGRGIVEREEPDQNQSSQS